MTEDDTKRAAGVTSGEPSTRREGSRNQALRFVIVFAVCVLTFLVSYRYAINTTANGWYLFQVARHTAMLLRGIGYSCNVESQLYLGPRRGSEKSDTAWSRWHERMSAFRARGVSLADKGPMVYFVLEPGPLQLLRDLDSKRAALLENRTMKRAARRERMRELRQAIKHQREQLRTPDRDEPGETANRGRFFTFKLVPDCGAIPSMSIYLAAIIAFPTRWRKRAVGVVLGLPLLYLINVFRVAFIAYLGAWEESGKLADFVHHYLWQGMFIVFVVGIWMLWIEFIVRRKET